MDVAGLVRLLRHGVQLKQTERSGWARRGVPRPESVAEHTFGVAFIALALAGQIEEPLDLGRLLALALLHDLPEALTGDIPRPVWRYLPAGSKAEAERAALAAMLDGEAGAGWLALWQELQAAESAEARLVKDADRLDLLLQASIYAQQSGNRRLEEFWGRREPFYYPAAAAVAQALAASRPPAEAADA
ncbi:MAG: HD domain-containing protein [Candidatus Promineifilaceae bacterium]